ncbi:hypothetical protein [Ruminococcus sp.]|uniref:hypothetical protein n=1 Tax=Ruminococcus sp. TaxID=41978 RepID=UPI0025F3B504|nr:hypothetical protein [Ruminococcus sp.]MBQ8965779.1 hypothetical protein [Ruminococcus sp.]
MTLSYFELKALSSQQEEKLTRDEIKMLEKKSGHSTMKRAFTVFSAMLLIASIYTLIVEKEFPLFYLLVLGFLGLPMTISLHKPAEWSAVYGRVIDKTVRCAKLSGKSTAYLPFEKTVEQGSFRHRYTLFETVGDYYYCTVEIGGQIYENVCCLEKDHPKIAIGERVVIANEDSYNCPVVYKCPAERK